MCFQASRRNEILHLPEGGELQAYAESKWLEYLEGSSALYRKCAGPTCNGEAMAANTVAVDTMAANTMTSDVTQPGVPHVQEYSDSNRRFCPVKKSLQDGSGAGPGSRRQSDRILFAGTIRNPGLRRILSSRPDVASGMG